MHIKTVRGEDRQKTVKPQPLSDQWEVIPPTAALKAWRQAHPADKTAVDKVSFQRDSNGEPVYAMFSASRNGGKWPFAQIYARTGTSVPPLTAEQAKQRALADFAVPVSVSEVRLIRSQPPAEYKGPLPIWQIILDDKRNTHLYVSPVDGQVLARRNSWWRAFDLLWMLHILDFNERDNFNNLLLRTVAPAAVIVVLSGYLLWWISRRRRKPSPPS